MAYQQMAPLEALLPHLRPGGVYLCEDVMSEYHAFHGYIALQRVDEAALESRLPAAIFYNLLLSARRP